MLRIFIYRKIQRLRPGLNPRIREPEASMRTTRPPKPSMYCVQVIRLFHRAEFTPFCKSYYLFTLLCLSKQTRHGRKTVSFYFFLFICGRSKCLSCEQSVGSSTSLRRLVLQIESAEVSRTVTSSFVSVLMLMKVYKIPRIELSTVHLCQRYSLFMHNKLQYTWRGDYWDCELKSASWHDEDT
jgi:hypothetical protein